MSLSVTISGTRAVVRGLTDMPTAMRRQVRQAFNDIGHTFVREFSRAHLRGKTGPENVSVRSGNLRRAFGHRVTGTARAEDLAMHLGFGRPAVLTADAGTVRYAATHMFGATIRPRTAKWLWIPIGRNRGRDGQAKLRPKDLPPVLYLSRTQHGPDTQAQGRARRRDAKDLVRTSARPIAFPRRAGPGWVILWRGQALFVLVDEVTIKPRLPLAREWARFAPRAMTRLRRAQELAQAEITAKAGAGASPTGGG